jgi:hypothetical protein
MAIVFYLIFMINISFLVRLLTEKFAIYSKNAFVGVKLYIITSNLELYN